MVVAIDGPSGVGKSTVSRAVADALGYAYLDTGSTYRAATLAVLEADVDETDEGAVLDVVISHVIDYSADGVLLDGVSVVAATRSEAVTSHVSAVSAHPAVRSAIVEIQRRWVSAHEGRVVVEGRDIGTVVFPDADLKVFLTADPEERAKRRHHDLADSEIAVSLEVVREQQNRRDRQDTSRADSPLQVAKGSVVVDTTGLSLDEVVERLIAEVANLFPQGA